MLAAIRMFGPAIVPPWQAPVDDRVAAGRDRGAWRVAVTIAAIVITQAVVCAVAALPVAAGWLALLRLVESPVPRLALIAALAVPSYLLFALALLVVSPLVTRIVCPPTPVDAELPIAGRSWALLGWCHRSAATRLVGVLAGALLRGSPVWSAYLRLNGARVGCGVFVNSTHLADHDLLDLGDGVVIGAEVHLSGHTVEGGVVKTARLRVGRGATIGVGSVVEIGVDVGRDCIVGALSLVPKHAVLAPGAVYVGIPARRLEPGAHARAR